jgi:hypothetical protein
VKQRCNEILLESEKLHKVWADEFGPNYDQPRKSERDTIEENDHEDVSFDIAEKKDNEKGEEDEKSEQDEKGEEEPKQNLALDESKSSLSSSMPDLDL